MILRRLLACLGLGLLWAAGPTYVSAATVNVDFGNAVVYSGQGGMPSAGDFWNGVPSDGNPTSALNLFDSMGAATTVGVAVFGAENELLPINSAEAGLANDLTRDGFRGLDNNPLSHLTLTISGLIAGNSYDLAVYGVQDATFGGFLSNNRGSTFNLGGNLQTSSGDNNAWPAGGFAVDVTHVLYDDVVADAGGSIVVDVSPFTQPADAGFPVAFLNGVQIDGVFVPEPSCAALLLVGALSAVAVGRFRR